MNLVFLGPPGSGKGTIANIAKDELDLLHISTGELFRKVSRENSDLGKTIKTLLAQGDLVPDDITVKLVKETLKRLPKDKGYILDGFPRTLYQGEQLCEIAHIDHVIDFVLDTQEILKRLTGRRVAPSTGKIYHLIYNPPVKEGLCDVTGEQLIQRADDTTEAIVHRLEVYEKQTEPLIAYYRERGLLRELDASGPPTEVFASLKRLIALL